MKEFFDWIDNWSWVTTILVCVGVLGIAWGLELWVVMKGKEDDRWR